MYCYRKNGLLAELHEFQGEGITFLKSKDIKKNLRFIGPIQAIIKERSLYETTISGVHSGGMV